MSTVAGRPVFPAPAQSWLELFFDLAFVAAIVVVSASYSRDYSMGQAAWLVLVFALIWTTWLMTTLRLQASTISGVVPRVLIVAQMALVLLMAITADDFQDNQIEPVGLFFGLVLATALFLNRSVTTPDDPARLTRSETGRLVAAIAVFLLTRFVGNAAVSTFMWAAALLLVLTTLRGDVVWDADRARRLTHRFGEFTIIVLGESFLKLALVAGEEPLEELDLYALPLVFAVITAIWWIYFAYVSPAGMPSRQRVWMLLHLPLHLFIIALAVGLSKLLLPESEAYQGSAFALITIPLVGVLVSLAVLLWVGGGPFARRGPRVLVAGAVATVAVVVLNYSARGAEFDLAGMALLLSIVLLVTIRGLGPLRVPGPRADAPAAAGSGTVAS